MGFSSHPRNTPPKKAVMTPLSFYCNPDVVQVAKSLIGKKLFSKIDGPLTGGIITETEAYAGIADKASHAYGGRRTKRTEILFHQGGVAYVYLCYGIHYLLNIVTSEENTPNGVLIRAIRPTHGIEFMLKRRKKMKVDPTLTTGPGAVTAALGITLKQYGISLNSRDLWIEDSKEELPFVATPRIGIDYAGDDALLPYRFLALSVKK